MALARIISRSHQCSRELALDLLARGYAVEIVSPDAIPDNLADLELRLDADNASQLTASVEAHSAAHAASLEFIHHLRAPMGDFIRRPPQANPVISVPAPAVSFNAEPGITADVGLPSENWHAPEPARARPEPLSEVEESARLIAPAEQRPTPSNEAAKPVSRGLPPKIQRPGLKEIRTARVQDLARLIKPSERWLVAAKELATDVARGLAQRIHRFELPKVAIPRSELKQMKVRSEDWLWRAGLTIATAASDERFWRIGLRIAAVVLMALVLGRGIRRSTASADPASPAQPNVAAPSEATVLPNPERKQMTAPSGATATAGKSEAKTAQVSTKPAAPQASSNSRAVRSRSREDDLVARDTVIYFDRSAQASPAKRRPRSQKQSGTVTDLR